MNRMRMIEDITMEELSETVEVQDKEEEVRGAEAAEEDDNNNEEEEERIMVDTKKI